MMGAVRSWLLAVIAVSLLCAVADALMPQGAVRRVGRLVCALVLMGAVLSPLTELDAAGGQRWLEEYLAQQRCRETELAETVNNRMKTIIEEQCAAYIVDKAAEFGWTCRARVTCRLSGEGVYLPVETQVAGLEGEEPRARMSRVIQEELGIPVRAQRYIEEEEMP